MDFRGHPVDKTKTGGWLAAGLILGSYSSQSIEIGVMFSKLNPISLQKSFFFYAGTELAERICVMGIAMNLVTYLVGDLNLPSADSATIVTNVMGTLNLLGLLGGFLADAKLGRYLTVAISATIAAVVC